MENLQQTLLADPIWVYVRETIREASELSKEASELSKETSLKMKEIWEQRQRIQAEEAVRHAELERVVRETSEQMKETDRQMKETDKKIKSLSDTFSNKWGKLVEAITRPAVLTLFKKEGIKVAQIFEGPRSGVWENHELEVDVILCDGDESVAVEVKSTCWRKDIDHFIDQMQYFKKIFKLFAPTRVYPAIAALEYKEHSDRYAEKKGLFVIRTSGEGLYNLSSPAVRLEF